VSACLKLIVITQQNKSVCADIEIVGEPRVVSQTLASSLITLRPQIVHHACRSGGTKLFGDSIVGALLPHAVEHIAIDLLVELFSHPTPLMFAGATTWLDHDAARMRVRVGCTNDSPPKYFAATEAALIEAVHLINRLLMEDKECD